MWGDPALYDSTLAVLEEVWERGTVAFHHDVVPGISSVSALVARHRTGLNRVGRPVQITTGRRLSEEGLPDGVDDVVVMLDAHQRFRAFAGQDVDIYWGAYIGTPDEILVSGPLAEAAPRIERLRAEARERKGWIMDTYLLRRSPATVRPSSGPREDVVQLTQCRRHVGGRGDPVRQRRAPDDDDREPEVAGGREFRGGRRAAAVLRHQHVDAVLAQQCRLVGHGERAAGQQHSGVRGHRRFGGSTDRTTKCGSVRSANAARPRRPVVRRTRRPSPGSSAAAASSEGTGCQWSPGPGRQPGRRSTTRGTPAEAVARAAFAVISAANGWVASTTASTCRSRSQAASPSGPPKPPRAPRRRARPAGSRVRRARWSPWYRGGRSARRRAGAPRWCRRGSARAVTCAERTRTGYGDGQRPVRR